MTKPLPPRSWIAFFLPLLIACGQSGGDGDASDSRPRLTDARATQDARALGRELFDLVDRAASYRSSHRGRNPRNLRDLGIDSLTPKTARWLVLRGGEPMLTVAYRRPDRGGIRECTGGLSVLEESALEGKIKLHCRTTDGVAREVAVDPSAQP